jgi:hypothetical protein
LSIWMSFWIFTISTHIQLLSQITYKQNILMHNTHLQKHIHKLGQKQDTSKQQKHKIHKKSWRKLHKNHKILKFHCYRTSQISILQNLTTLISIFQIIKIHKPPHNFAPFIAKKNTHTHKEKKIKTCKIHYPKTTWTST